MSIVELYGIRNGSEQTRTLVATFDAFEKALNYVQAAVADWSIQNPFRHDSLLASFEDYYIGKTYSKSVPHNPTIGPVQRPIVKALPIPPKDKPVVYSGEYQLENMYQDSGWEPIAGEIFTNYHKAEERARELSKDGICYGMIRIVDRKTGVEILVYGAGSGGNY